MTGDPNVVPSCVNQSQVPADCWTPYVKAKDYALKLEVKGKSGWDDPGIRMIERIDTPECDFWDDNYNLDGYK